MELIGLVVVGNGECVSSFISLRVLVVKARSGVERLVQVSNIVDEKTEGVRPGSIVVAGVESVLNIVIHVRLLVAFPVLSGEPVGNVLDGHHDVVGGNHIGAGVVSGSLTCLVDEWVINEVEVGLPHTSMVLDIISECGTLDERVVSLVAS